MPAPAAKDEAAPEAADRVPPPPAARLQSDSSLIQMEGKVIAEATADANADEAVQTAATDALLQRVLVDEKKQANEEKRHSRMQKGDDDDSSSMDSSRSYYRKADSSTLEKSLSPPARVFEGRYKPEARKTRSKTRTAHRKKKTSPQEDNMEVDMVPAVGSATEPPPTTTRYVVQFTQTTCASPRTTSCRRPAPKSPSRAPRLWSSTLFGIAHGSSARSTE